MTKILSFQLSEQEYQALDEIAKNNERSKGYIIRQCMRQYLQDVVDGQNAKKIIGKINSGKIKTVKWKDLKKQQ